MNRKFSTTSSDNKKIKLFYDLGMRYLVLDILSNGTGFISVLIFPKTSAN